MRQHRLLTTLVAAAAVAVSGCGGGSDAADSTIASTEPTSATPTTGGHPTITSSTEVTTNTSVAPSTNPPTSEPPTTEIAPSTAEPTPVEETVIAAVLAAQEDYLYAVYNPDAPDAIDRLRARATGKSLERGLELFEEITSNGWLVRPNPDVPDRTTIASPVELITDTLAEVTICEVGAGVVVAPGAAADGSDVIVNDLIEVDLFRVTMVLEEGTWKLSSGTSIEELEEPSACDAF